MRVRKPVDDLLEEIEDTMLDEDDDANWEDGPEMEPDVAMHE